MPTAALATAYETAPAHLTGLFGELNDLKRIRSAGRAGSIASRLFRGAWLALVRGDPFEAVMRRTAAAALCAARLADLDRSAPRPVSRPRPPRRYPVWARPRRYRRGAAGRVRQRSRRSAGAVAKPLA